MPQLMAAFGICVGYFTCYGSIKIESSISWRLPFILMAVAAIMLAVSCFFLPTSPRWSMLHDRRGDALRALERLNISSVEAEKDILGPILSSQPRLTPWKGFLSIFHRQYRLRTVLGLFVLGMVQLSGIDGVIYVSLELVQALKRVSSVMYNRYFACAFTDRINNHSMPQSYSLKPVYQLVKPHSLLQAFLLS